MKNKLNYYLFLILKAMAAGAAIACGGVLSIVSKAYLTVENGSYGNLLGAFLFPVGLLMVCFLSFNLYTGKIGFFSLKKPVKQQVIDLSLILLFNVLTAMLCGYLFYLITLNNEVIHTYLVTSLYQSKTSALTAATVLKTFCYAMGCGVCVYLAVICYKKLKTIWGKIIGIIIPIFLFAYLGLDHCIANAFYYGAMMGFSNYTIYVYLLLAIVGNSTGSILINKVFDTYHS